MKLKTITLLGISIALSACLSNDRVTTTHENPKKDSQTKQNLIAEKAINNITGDEKSIPVLGKAILYKVKEGCQINHSFIYSTTSVVTYQYIFNKNKLISSYSTFPDEFDANKMNRIWNDADDKNIIDNFNKIKQVFSTAEISQCL